MPWSARRFLTSEGVQRYGIVDMGGFCGGLSQKCPGLYVFSFGVNWDTDLHGGVE